MPRKDLMVTEEGYKLKKSIYCTNESAVCISDRMEGKMEDTPSISTSVKLNKFCLARIENGDSICSECFAVQALSFKKGLRENCEQNFELLNKRILNEDELPKFKKLAERCRIESFGDVDTVTQAINYINICNHNPYIMFSVWSKNHAIWDKAFKQCGKPKNFIFVLSSEKLNEVTHNDKNYDWVDHVFTVYTLEYALEHNIKINCGKKRCIDCNHCYMSTEGKPYYINEIVKKDQLKKDYDKLIIE